MGCVTSLSYGSFEAAWPQVQSHLWNIGSHSDLFIDLQTICVQIAVTKSCCSYMPAFTLVESFTNSFNFFVTGKISAIYYQFEQELSKKNYIPLVMLHIPLPPIPSYHIKIFLNKKHNWEEMLNSPYLGYNMFHTLFTCCPLHPTLMPLDMSFASPFFISSYARCLLTPPWMVPHQTQDSSWIKH